MTHLGPETGRTACQPSWGWLGCEVPPPPNTLRGLVSRQPLYHVDAYYHILNRANAGNLTPGPRSSPPSAPNPLLSPFVALLLNFPRLTPTSTHLSVPLSASSGAFCFPKVSDAIPDLSHKCVIYGLVPSESLDEIKSFESRLLCGINSTLKQ